MQTRTQHSPYHNVGRRSANPSIQVPQHNATKRIKLGTTY